MATPSCSARFWRLDGIEAFQLNGDAKAVDASGRKERMSASFMSS
jgi:hypothetical protein